jgi:peptidoglycan/xylan/chitin deacetylase (PgdA/CDA1 family)
MYGRSYSRCKMKLIVTIDTEEDNWGDYRPDGHTLRNIERVPELQQLFDEFAVRPTYLISYPVAADDRSVFLLKGIQKRGGCEIGTHCHPWNTPPFKEENSEKNSMLCNLPALLQHQKIEALHNLIERRFGTAPTSFRSGRWGYSQEVARALQVLNYKVDSSITPYHSWRDYYGPDYTEVGPEPYLFSPDHLYRAVNRDESGLVEVPATIGYLRTDFDRNNRILKVVTSKQVKWLHLSGVLSRLCLVNKVWLCPERSGVGEMIDLARMMRRKGFPALNLFFHSPTLQAGCTPYAQTRDDVRRFVAKIRAFLVFAREAEIASSTLSEAADLIREESNCSQARSIAGNGGW